MNKDVSYMLQYILKTHIFFGNNVKIKKNSQNNSLRSIGEISEQARSRG